MLKMKVFNIGVIKLIYSRVLSMLQYTYCLLFFMLFSSSALLTMEEKTVNKARQKNRPIVLTEQVGTYTIQVLNPSFDELKAIKKNTDENFDAQKRAEREEKEQQIVKKACVLLTNIDSILMQKRDIKSLAKNILMLRYIIREINVRNDVFIERCEATGHLLNMKYACSLDDLIMRNVLYWQRDNIIKVLTIASNKMRINKLKRDIPYVFFMTSPLLILTVLIGAGVTSDLCKIKQSNCTVVSKSVNALGVSLFGGLLMFAFTYIPACILHELFSTIKQLRKENQAVVNSGE